jgi:hypothetical protein
MNNASNDDASEDQDGDSNQGDFFDAHRYFLCASMIDGGHSEFDVLPGDTDLERLAFPFFLKLFATFLWPTPSRNAAGNVFNENVFCGPDDIRSLLWFYSL